MFLLRRPSEDDARRYVVERETAPLTYPEVGASRGTVAPPGYLRNFAVTRLGAGEATFRRASDALRRWAMYDLGWTWIVPPGTPAEPGRTVGVLVRHYGFWSLHACRVVYAIDEPDGPVRRSGFAIGTVADHAERGEERFTVEWSTGDDRVRFELFSFSRPAAPLAVLGFPLARGLQRRFARETLPAMRAAVEPAHGGA
ncbi:MAG TPA: DUF1990 domain-containing protein [Longimicrobiaceae bacterium]|nr:DUF1990 domain-containing protein [Longimicrobiaceae bacterium]